MIDIKSFSVPFGGGRVGAELMINLEKENHASETIEPQNYASSRRIEKRTYTRRKETVSILTRG